MNKSGGFIFFLEIFYLNILCKLFFLKKIQHFYNASAWYILQYILFELMKLLRWNLLLKLF